MNRLINWFDDRTGIKALLHEALYEHVPGGARWRYVWGSTLVFAFAVQMITGLFLTMAYSPSNSTAWESVYYIQYQMQFGWLLRGLHHFMAQAMIVLLVLHLLQVIIDGAYRAPREVNFWLGLILMQIVLGLSLTGYLLPWDQKGFWATRVATNLAGIIPVVGPDIQRLIVGGSEYGHHTLTRFFALHAGVLPALLVGFLVLHIAIFRRHGLHAADPKRKPDGMFWPDQILKDAVACLAVLAAVLFFIFLPAIKGASAGDQSLTHLGADLGAPADGSNPYDARPEWYFLFLFQFLKFFPGETLELIGAIVIPGLIMGVLFLMPFLGKWKLGHRFNVGFIAVLMIGIGVLTMQAMYADRHSTYMEAPAELAEGKPDDQLSPAAQRYKTSRQYLKSVEEAEKQAHRAIALASQGIPPSGMLGVLRQDPYTQGPQLFTRYCASCHSHADATGQGIIAAVPAGEKLGAPNLYGFASRDWIAGVLNPEKIAGPDYFGNTAHAEGEMASFVTGDLKDKSATDLADVIVAISAEAALPGQLVADAKDTEQIARGREILANGDVGCMDCHKFRDTDNGGTAPDLTGYGSRAWLTGMIGNPAHAGFYGENNDRMPVFVKDPQDPKLNIISQQDLDLLVSWLRGEWVEPVTKEPIEESASEPAADASPAEAESTAEAAPE